MDYLIDQILSVNNISFGIFDQNLILRRYSKNFFSIANYRVKNENTSIWEILPEFIGSEDQVEAILNNKLKDYKLDRLSKYTDDKKIIFYNLILQGLKEHPPKLLCIISDITSQMSLEQQIHQQESEINLLRASLSIHGNFYLGGIIGESAKIKEVRNFIIKIAHVKSATILIQGESGTGKNLVARIIHNTSSLPQSSFVEINCAAIPHTLLESEIFGYEKGAFTSATTSKIGLLEKADGGTFFLDEIGELSLSLQAKLLTFLETKTFRRLGSIHEKNINVRIIAATSKDLKQAVEKGEFRRELFYRINVLNLILPPLRELGEDTVLIAENFIRMFAYEFKRRVTGLTESAKIKLLSHCWTGNVRELRNVIERAVIFTSNEEIDVDDIKLDSDGSGQAAHPQQEFSIPQNGICLEEVEEKLIREAISKTKGNQTQAAKLLNLTLDTFRYRMKKYKITI